jgi:uncharacterized protein (UPF0332 family)
VPNRSPDDDLLLWVGALKIADLTAVQAAGQNKYPFPVADMVKRSASGRFSLAASHLRSADDCLVMDLGRAAISRYYYAMYNAARAITFCFHQGDDHQSHSDLPDHLPANLPNIAARRNELLDARLARNQADYDPFPDADHLWLPDAQQFSTIAPAFVQECEQYAQQQGMI